MTEAKVVELDGLEKPFRTKKGAIVAVRGVDISIRAGEIVALLGPNGAGKSTTIDMLLGLTRPDAGIARVLGGRPSEATSAGTVGVMLQTGSLPRDLSVHELLAMVASLYPAPLAIDELLRLVGIDAIADRRTQSCPAARRSACALRSRWCRIPSCSFWTSRPSRWTSSLATHSARRCVSLPPAAPRSCSQRTSSRKRIRTRTVPC
jgi:ABC-type lipopolysaccharide export system ATPase subunit